MIVNAESEGHANLAVSLIALRAIGIAERRGLSESKRARRSRLAREYLMI